METRGDEVIFVDANALIYSKQQQSPFNAAATQRLENLERQGKKLWASRQVLREYLAVMSRQEKLTKKVATPALLEDVRGFTERFRVADEGVPVMERLLWLLERVEAGGKQVHAPTSWRRCLKVASSTSLTHNTGDFERFEDYVTVLPLMPEE